MNTTQTNNTIRAYLASLGRIGGRKGSRADKVRAGKLGAQARYGKKQPTKATNNEYTRLSEHSTKQSLRQSSRPRTRLNQRKIPEPRTKYES